MESRILCGFRDSELDAIVVGAGIAGLAAAWGLSRRGHRVTIVSDDAADAASPVAGGMLAPGSELDYGEDDLHESAVRSLAAWPEFAGEIEEQSGASIGFGTPGTLAVALDRDEDAVLARHADLLQDHGIDHELLTGREAHRAEPALRSRIAGALRVPGEASVVPESALAALRAALEQQGARFATGSAELLGDQHGVHGVRLGGVPITAPVVVLAAGHRSRTLAASVDLPVPVRPVKGEILTLRPDAEVPQAMIRARIDNHPIYLVPRPDGTLLAGATTWDTGETDTRPTVRAALDLLGAAAELVPGLRDAEVVAHRVGLRPGTPDNRPLVGPTEVPGLLLATGHFRHGFLLAPETARQVGDAVLDLRAPEDVASTRSSLARSADVGTRSDDVEV